MSFPCTPLGTSQAGPQGPAGEQGPAGANGMQGPQGPAGEDGVVPSQIGQITLTTLNQEVNVNGIYTAGMYKLYGQDLSTGDFVVAELSVRNGNIVTYVENNSGGVEFEFKVNSNVLQLRNLTANGNVVKITALQIP